MGLGGLLGGILGTETPKSIEPVAPAPVAEAPKAEIKEEETKAKAARASLYSTPGGVMGEELTDEQVKKRPTLLGN